MRVLAHEPASIFWHILLRLGDANAVIYVSTTGAQTLLAGVVGAE